jgi:hypothetical protein
LRRGRRSKSVASHRPRPESRRAPSMGAPHCGVCGNGMRSLAGQAAGRMGQSPSYRARVCVCVCVCVFAGRTVTIVSPSGEMARYSTRSVWPVRVVTFAIVGYLHTITCQPARPEHPLSTHGVQQDDATQRDGTQRNGGGGANHTCTYTYNIQKYAHIHTHRLTDPHAHCQRVAVVLEIERRRV